MRSGPTTRVALLAGAALALGCATGCDSAGTPAGTAAPAAAGPATTAPARTAAPAAPGTSPPAGSAPALARCRTADVTVSVGPVSASASGRSASLILAARPGRRCTVAGYGGLQLLDRGRSPLRTTLRRVAARYEPVPVGGPVDPPVLAKKLSWSVLPAGPGGSPQDRCPRPAYATLTLPDETTSLVLRWTLPVVCDGDVAGGPWLPEAG